jgi:hypothetical protein
MTAFAGFRDPVRQASVPQCLCGFLRAGAFPSRWTWHAAPPTVTLPAMIRGFHFPLGHWSLCVLLAVCCHIADGAQPPSRKTSVSIVGDEFYINGKPTYEGREWRGKKIQGLLLNSRMVQGIFDDRNSNTVRRWRYPDSQRWDAERNTREFIAAMPDWRRQGLLAFTINLQGGSPEGYSKDQPWHNSGIEADGSLRRDYLDRLGRILDRADQLGMVVILGYFYFGQDERLRDEAAVIRATDNITDWLFERGYRNVLIEINNECNVRYDHAILQPARIHELIDRVRNRTQNNRRFYVGTSYGGGTIPGDNVVRVSDFILIHGNGVSDPNRIAEMVKKTRQVRGYFQKPILFNEDDHFDFEKPTNNFVAALSEYASWGYFDPGKNNYNDGYQSPPVNWSINTPRKRAFFSLLADITGGAATPTPSRITSYASTGTPHASRGASRVNYHGWPNSYVLSNGKVEAVVVPAIGRIMQFGFAGDEGVFWENRALDGQAPDPNAEKWINFGGDKTWPAPEAEWAKHTGRKEWMPPPAFDSMPVQAQPGVLGVTLISPLDPHYGIKTHRRIELDGNEPVMRVTTTYEKVSGKPARVGVWTITQLKDPVGVYVPISPDTIFTDRYALLSQSSPPTLKVGAGLISLKRDAKSSYKIGSDAGALLWVGAKYALRIDAPRQRKAEYPDQGSSVEVYTNPDPLQYIELETLGPLKTLKVGERLEHTVTYTLIRRTELDPEAEARKILKR